MVVMHDGSLQQLRLPGGFELRQMEGGKRKDASHDEIGAEGDADGAGTPELLDGQVLAQGAAGRTTPVMDELEVEHVERRDADADAVAFAFAIAVDVTLAVTITASMAIARVGTSRTRVEREKRAASGR